MITYHKGDLFKLLPQDNEGIIYVPHVVNNANSFSSGFAAGIAKNWPNVKSYYHTAAVDLGLELGTNQYVGVRNAKLNINRPIYCVNMIAQVTPGTRKPIRYAALVKCMVELDTRLKYYIRNGGKDYVASSIWCPQFGSLRAGGTWAFIEELIEEIWGDLDVNICVYDGS